MQNLPSSYIPAIIPDLPNKYENFGFGAFWEPFGPVIRERKFCCSLTLHKRLVPPLC